MAYHSRPPTNYLLRAYQAAREKKPDNYTDSDSDDEQEREVLQDESGAEMVEQARLASPIEEPSSAYDCGEADANRQRRSQDIPCEVASAKSNPVAFTTRKIVLSDGAVDWIKFAGGVAVGAVTVVIVFGAALFVTRNNDRCTRCPLVATLPSSLLGFVCAKCVAPLTGK